MQILCFVIFLFWLIFVGVGLIIFFQYFDLGEVTYIVFNV